MAQHTESFVLSEPICAKWFHIRLRFRVFRRHRQLHVCWFCCC